MKKTLLATLAMAAALSASAATTPNLVTNGEPGNNLNGWTNFGSSNFESWFDWEDYNWFRAYGNNCCLSQTIVLADKGITPKDIAYGATVTASIIASGGNTGNATVYQLGADDGVLASNTVFAVKNQVASTSYPEIEFALNPSTRKLKYELVAEEIESSYNLKFRNCSLKVTTLPQYQITFISNGATVGTTNCFNLTTLTPPAASRDGYRFLGYFTQASGGEQVFDESYAPVNSSTWTPTDGASLYAHWVIESVNFSFVSENATVGSAEYQTTNSAPAAPTVSRSGDYQFLGYFTEDGLQVYDGNYQFVQSALSSLSSDTTLYAHWAVPEGSVAKLVYRGQLTLLGTDNPAADTQKYTKKMHFRVYDDESATTPVWQIDNQTVTVNKDGSFMAMFGDETLAALIATGLVSHVGVAIGENAGQAIELKPRREIRPVAVVNRALVAEAAGTNPRVGNLVTENALAANNVTISQLEVAGTVTAPGAGPVDVSPVVVGERETLTLLRGDGVNVFSKDRVDLGTTDNVQRGQKIGTKAAPSDGIALITSSKSGARGLRIPGVIQYCRKGEYVRAPASEPDGVKVTFFPFVGSAR